MTFSDEDKAYIRNVVEESIDGRNQAVDKNGKEFLFHLYDALWENMRSKESRLWTFLSLYGAAVGLVFAGGQVSQVPGADLFAMLIVMALTTWAVLIILNANWWYYRNQLIVSRIEIQFPDTVKGIVPRIYHENPKYRYDQLSKGSILLLSLLLLLLYSRTMWSYHSAGAINNWQSLVVVILLYVLFVLSADYCLRLHESNVADYYKTKKIILEDASSPAALAVEVRHKLLKDETETRELLDARIYIFALLALAAGLFDLIIYRNGITFGWLITIWVVQALAVLIFLVQGKIYHQSFSDEELRAVGNDQQITRLENKLNLKDRSLYRFRYMILLVLLSGTIAVFSLYRNNQELQADWKGTKTASSMDVGEQINKMQQDFQGLQKSYNELQQSNVELQKQLLDEKLKPYTTRDEAEQHFMTKEAFDNFLKSQPKAKP